MDPDNVTDTKECRQLLLLMGEKRNRDTAIIGIAHVTRLLVMHGWIDDLQQLSVEVFLRMWA